MCSGAPVHSRPGGGGAVIKVRCKQAVSIVEGGGGGQGSIRRGGKGGGGLGPKSLCPKNGLTRFSRQQLSAVCALSATVRMKPASEAEAAQQYHLMPRPSHFRPLEALAGDGNAGWRSTGGCARVCAALAIAVALIVGSSMAAKGLRPGPAAFWAAGPPTAPAPPVVPRARPVLRRASPVEAGGHGGVRRVTAPLHGRRVGEAPQPFRTRTTATARAHTPHNTWPAVARQMLLPSAVVAAFVGVLFLDARRRVASRAGVRSTPAARALRPAPPFYAQPHPRVPPAKASPSDSIDAAMDNLEELDWLQMAIMYVDALRSHQEGHPLLSDEQFNELKMELNWQGSDFPPLSRTKIRFVEAALQHARGLPMLSDEEYEALKEQVRAEGHRSRDVTAFLEYVQEVRRTIDAKTDHDA